jgi:hypothetical protein
MTTITRNVYLNGQKVEVNARNPAVAASPRLCHTGGMPARVTTDGTDATPSVTETYLAEVYVSETCTITGVSIFNGSAVAGNVTVGYYNANGYLLASSATTVQAGTDAYQNVDFSAALSAVPGTHYVAVQFDNTGARFNTHVIGAFGAGKLTGQTYGVLPKATMPTTFTTALGPIATLY